jgi:vitamin B12 transporter
MKKLILFLSVLLSLYAKAQERETVLDPVTVSASLISKPVSQTGRNIVIIKGGEFSNLPVNSVDELLRYLPGVEVQMRGPMGSQSDIVIRGGTFQQVLVIMDGVRLNDPNTGHFNSYIPIVPTEIDHIEILKGASSAIYGSEAVGGVINIITKTFASRPFQPKAQVHAEGMLGEYKLANANVGASWQGNRSAIGGGWFSDNTQGQLQRGTRGYVYNNTGTISFSHFFNDKLQLAFRSSYDSRDFSAQNFYTSFASDTAKEKVRTFWNQARLKYTSSGHNIIFDAGWKKVKDNFLYNKASIENENKSSLFQTTVSDEWKLNSKTTLVNGIQLINKGIRSNDRGDHNLFQTAAFFILNESFKNFVVNPAIRIDWNTGRGAELVPQINLSWKRNKVQLRGSAGKTIRDADFTERYNNYNKPIVTGGSIGDPDLKAERSFSYEAGADYFFTNYIKIAGTFFQRFHKRLIDYVPTPYADMPRKDNLVQGNTYALAKNISQVTTTGGELDIQIQKNFDNKSRIYSAVGIVWLNSNSSNSTQSFYILSHARFMTNFSIEYTNKIFSISVNGVYKNRPTRSTPAMQAYISEDYFILNTKTVINLWKNKLKGSIQISNLFNERYSDLLGSIMPHRWLLAGLLFDFAR